MKRSFGVAVVGVVFLLTSVCLAQEVKPKIIRPLMAPAPGVAQPQVRQLQPRDVAPIQVSQPSSSKTGNFDPTSEVPNAEITGSSASTAFNDGRLWLVVVGDSQKRMAPAPQYYQSRIVYFKGDPVTFSGTGSLQATMYYDLPTASVRKDNPQNDRVELAIKIVDGNGKSVFEKVLGSSVPMGQDQSWSQSTAGTSLPAGKYTAWAGFKVSSPQDSGDVVAITNGAQLKRIDLNVVQ